MSLINFVDIDFNKSINKENKTIHFNGSEIQIVNHLSANDKYDLIMITLQKALDQNIYNPFKIDLYFDLNTVYLYTNILFTNEDRVDEFALYDILKRSGLLDMVKSAIDENELKELKEYVLHLAEIITMYRNTFGAVVGGFIEQLPQNMEKAKDIIGEFDPEKYQGLLELAKNIKTTTPVTL